MTADAMRRLVVTHRYSASPERVYDAWLDPGTAGRFLFATPGGVMKRVEIDPRVGGDFVIVERRGDADAEHYGRFLELDRPRRIVFRFGVTAYDVDGAVISIDIVAVDGGCELTLTHEVAAEWAERSLRGWTMILEGLATALA
ncbi:MAG: SRPBCC domain-containing protein [Caulobacterales bacterium]|jgi:uncharacterized protein YndB with AHSA1/START domain